MQRNNFYEVFKGLTYREREVVNLRFGLADDDLYTYTLAEVGRIFKLTPQRIHQVQTKAIQKLKRSRQVAKAKSLGLLSPYVQITAPDRWAQLARQIAKGL